MDSNKYLYDVVIPGMRFGTLTVIEEDFDAEAQSSVSHKFFKCRCDCGNCKSVDVYNLINGSTKSCGCHKIGVPKSKLSKNLTGMAFGNLIVIRRDPDKPIGAGKHVYWICECTLCGTIKSIRSNDLIDGNSVDCGCGRSRRISDGIAKDLNNMRFGHLLVIEKDLSKIKSGSRSFWICQCDICGRIESISSYMLLTYGKDRCKFCSGISNGESKIAELLEDNGIPFIHDKPYGDFKYSISGGTPRFDFRITKNSNCDYIIEFDGEQHFKDVSFGPGQYHDLEYWQKRDLEKNEFCIQNNIPLIRVPYNALRNLDILDIIPETSSYLVS